MTEAEFKRVAGAVGKSQKGFTFYEFVGALSGKTKQKDESLGDTSTHLGELIDATKFSELLGEDEKTVKPLLFFPCRRQVSRRTSF